MFTLSVDIPYYHYEYIFEMLPCYSWWLLPTEEDDFCCFGVVFIKIFTVKRILNMFY